MNRKPTKISRRTALRDIAAIGIGVPMAHLLGASTTTVDGAETNALGTMVSKPLFSTAERNRRWEAVRRIMAKPEWNLDALLTPSSSDTAYPRYLTQIGGRGGSADVIFPRDAVKPVYAYTGSGRNKNFWLKRLASWTSDGKLITTMTKVPNPSLPASKL